MRRTNTDLSAVDTLVERARRLRRRGESRKALVALREACTRDDRAAWTWTLYAAWLTELGRSEEAETALRHAIWLRKKDGDGARVHSTERLLARVRHAA